MNSVLSNFSLLSWMVDRMVWIDLGASCNAVERRLRTLVSSVGYCGQKDWSYHDTGVKFSTGAAVHPNANYFLKIGREHSSITGVSALF